MQYTTTKSLVITVRALVILTVLTCLVSCSGYAKKSENIGSEKRAVEQLGDTVQEILGEIRGITQDAQFNMWFVSNGNGVYKYDGKSIVNYRVKDGLSSDDVWMVKEGRDGKMWFKTSLRSQDLSQICSFDGSRFEHVPIDTTTDQYDFKRGELIFEYYLHGNKLSQINLPFTSPIPNEENRRHHYDIYATCLDKYGNAWFGTATAGICKYDGEKFTWFDNKELGSATRDLFEDKNGVLWMGNNGDGLFRYDGKDFVNFSREKNLHNPDFEKYPIGKPGLMSRVWKITEDQQGNLWVATIDNGIWRISDRAITNFTTKDGLSIDNIWTVYIDKQGKLWVGTEGDGIFIFDGKTFAPFKV